jgi:hypothetical protein
MKVGISGALKTANLKILTLERKKFFFCMIHSKIKFKVEGLFVLCPVTSSIFGLSTKRLISTLLLFKVSDV